MLIKNESKSKDLNIKLQNIIPVLLSPELHSKQIFFKRRIFLHELIKFPPTFSSSSRATSIINYKVKSRYRQVGGKNPPGGNFGWLENCVNWAVWFDQSTKVGCGALRSPA